MHDQDGSASPARPPSWLAWAYGVSAVALVPFAAVPPLLLLYYLTETVHVPAAWAALALGLPLALQVVLNPLFGAWSDRLAGGRWGRRAPFMLAGGLVLPVAMASMFALPPVPWPWALAWCVAAGTAASASSAAYGVPYAALALELSADAEARTRLIALRTAFTLGGLLLFAGLCPALVHTGDAKSYARMGFVVGALSLAAMAPALVVALAARRHPVAIPNAAPAPSKSRPAGWRIMASNPLFLGVVAIFAVQNVAAAVATADLPYFAHEAWGGDGALAWAFTVLSLASILGVPLSAWIAERVGLRRALLGATVFYAAASAAPYAVGPATPVLFNLVLAANGLAFGAVALFLQSLLPDAVEADRRRSGEAREGTYMGAFAAAAPLSNGLGGVACSLALSAAGQGAGGAHAPEAIRLLASLIPAALVLSSLAFAPLLGSARPHEGGGASGPLPRLTGRRRRGSHPAVASLRERP